MDGFRLSFLDICLTVKKKPRKKLNQENWHDRGLNPGPLCERKLFYPSTTPVVSTLVIGTIELGTLVFGTTEIGTTVLAPMR